jgi:hypothetical protein
MPARKSPKANASTAHKSESNVNINSSLDRSALAIHTWLGGISLECPSPVPAQALATGERQVEFRLQQQVQPGLKSDTYVQILRLTIHITWQSNLLLIMELELCAEYHMLPDSDILAKTAEKLYQSYRPTIQSLLAAAGHQPPLPTTLSDVKS